MRLIIGDRSTGRSTALADWAWEYAKLRSATVLLVTRDHDETRHLMNLLAERLAEKFSAIGSTTRRMDRSIAYHDREVGASVWVESMAALEHRPHLARGADAIGVECRVDAGELAAVLRQAGVYAPIMADVLTSYMALTVIELGREQLHELHPSLDGMVRLGQRGKIRTTATVIDVE